MIVRYLVKTYSEGHIDQGIHAEGGSVHLTSLLCKKYKSNLFLNVVDPSRLVKGGQPYRAEPSPSVRVPCIN